MLSLLIVVFLAVAIVGFVRYEKSCESSWLFAGIVGVICCILFGVALLVNLDAVVSIPTKEKKIVMYQEENEKIASDIDKLVQNYMAYESDTYSKFKPETAADSMTMVSLYPELKADKLVQSQLKIHRDNSKTIMELKASLIDGSNAKWWVYFGR